MPKPRSAYRERTRTPARPVLCLNPVFFSKHTYLTPRELRLVRRCVCCPCCLACLRRVLLLLEEVTKIVGWGTRPELRYVNMQTTPCASSDPRLLINSLSLMSESHTHRISIPRDLLRKTPLRYHDSRVTDRKCSLSQILRYFERGKDEQHSHRSTTHARLRKRGRRAPKNVCVRCVKTDVARPFLL